MACPYRRTLFHRSVAERDCFADGVVETLDCGPLIWIDGLRLRFSFRTWGQDGGSFGFISILGQHTVRRHSLLASSPTGKHRLINPWTRTAAPCFRSHATRESGHNGFSCCHERFDVLR